MTILKLMSSTLNIILEGVLSGFASGEPSSAHGTGRCLLSTGGGRSASLMMLSEMFTSSMMMERRLTVAVLPEKTKYSLSDQGEFPLAPMGVLATGSAHARPSAWTPIDTNGNFPAHVSAESFFNNF